MSRPVDFAKCPCGHSNPVRPSTLSLPGDGQKSSEPDVTVACSECSLVSTFSADELEPKETMYGLSPCNPDAPLHVFRMTLLCDMVGCKTPLVILGVRKRDTEQEALGEETKIWRWEGLRCPSGHPIHDRERRLP